MVRQSRGVVHVGVREQNSAAMHGSWRTTPDIEAQVEFGKLDAGFEAADAHGLYSVAG